jgi:hypothetical protein
MSQAGSTALRALEAQTDESRGSGLCGAPGAAENGAQSAGRAPALQASGEASHVLRSFPRSVRRLVDMIEPLDLACCELLLEPYRGAAS